MLVLVLVQRHSLVSVCTKAEHEHEYAGLEVSRLGLARRFFIALLERLQLFRTG